MLVCMPHTQTKWQIQSNHFAFVFAMRPNHQPGMWSRKTRAFVSMHFLLCGSSFFWSNATRFHTELGIRSIHHFVWTIDKINCKGMNKWVSTWWNQWERHPTVCKWQHHCRAMSTINIGVHWGRTPRTKRRPTNHKMCFLPKEKTNHIFLRQCWNNRSMPHTCK